MPPKAMAKRGRTLLKQLNDDGMQQHSGSLWKPELLLAHLNRSTFTYHEQFDMVISKDPGTLGAVVKAAKMVGIMAHHSSNVKDDCLVTLDYFEISLA